jgi:hypothetical protein
MCTAEVMTVFTIHLSVVNPVNTWQLDMGSKPTMPQRPCSADKLGNFLLVSSCN